MCYNKFLDIVARSFNDNTNTKKREEMDNRENKNDVRNKETIICNKVGWIELYTTSTAKF